MKQSVPTQRASGILDYVALALTTFGVGYIPGAPGTYGSAAGVAIYLLVTWFEKHAAAHGMELLIEPAVVVAFHWTLNALLLAAFALLGIWASGRSIPLLGNEDPSEAVVDEVMGQLLTYAFVPAAVGWPFILAGFLLFRLFDIWKPYPIRQMELLTGGLGICTDDLVAGVYAGICLAVVYAVYLLA